MADLEISVDINAKKLPASAGSVKREIKGIGDEVEKTEKRVKKGTSAAAVDLKQMEAAAKDASEIAGKMGAVFGTVFGLIVAGAAAATVAVIEFAKNFAAAGVEVGKFQAQTGFAAETISALETQFRRTKTSGDDFREGMKNLTKTIGDAATGSDKAAAKLVRLGLDPKKAITDLDGAFRQILQRIVSLKTPTEQMNAAIDAFGDNGGKLLPFIRSFNGDLDGLVKKAKEFGTVLTEQDVRAAQEFDKSMSEVSESLRGLMMTLGRDFLPTVKIIFDSIRGWLKDNREDIKTMSENTGFVLLGLVRYWQDAANAVGGYIDKVREAAGGKGSAGDIALSTAAKVAMFGPAFPLIAGAEVAIGAARRRGQSSASLTGTLGGGVFTGPERSGGDAGGSNAGAPKLTDEQKEAIRQAKLLDDTIRDLNLQIQFYGDTSEVASVKQSLLKGGIDIVNNALAQQAIQLAGDIDKKNADAEATKKAAEEQKRYHDSFAQLQESLTSSGFTATRDRFDEAAALRKQLELGRELNDNDRLMIANARQLADLAEAGKNLKKEDLAILVDQLLTLQNKAVLDTADIQRLKEKLALQQAVKALQADLNAELAELTELYSTGADVTTVFRIQQELLKDTYKGLSDEQRQQILATAAQIDSMKAAMKAQDEMKRQYDEFYGTIRDSLQVLSDEGFGGLFKSIQQRFRSFLLDMASQWIASTFFKMFYGGGNSKTAQQNGQGGGGIFGAIFNGVFGGGAGQGPGGTGVFNPGYFTGGGQGTGPVAGGNLSAILNSGILTNANGDMGQGSGRGAGGSGILGNLRQIFSNQQGGLFSPLGGSKIGGYLNGAGSIAALVGSLIPGRAGGILSGVGTGVAMGAQIGSIIPGIGTVIGAAIGGIVGLIGSLFGGNKAEKRDKKEKMPQLEAGFIDAMKQLRDLIRDVKTLRVDPDTALSKATEIRQSIASGFGIQFESKKYGKQAQSLIASRLVEADALIEELRKAAEVARAASERDRRMLPEFAAGGYIDFKRYNGMIGGVFTGRDTLPAMLSRGEMVLNPGQQSRVRAAAGYDVFKTAGIPGYADGGVARGVTMGGPLNVTVIVEQDARGMWQATAESDAGQRVIAKVVSNKYANGELTLSKRP